MSEDRDTHMVDMPRRVRDAVNRSEIDQLVSRHFLTPDDRRSEREWLESVYTDDFVLVLPHESYRGYDGMVRAIDASAALFGRGHHLVGNNVTEFDGGSASIRSKLIATHLARTNEPHDAFTGGAEYDFEAVYTAAGWRLTRAEYKGVWIRGEAPAPSKG